MVWLGRNRRRTGEIRDTGRVQIASSTQHFSAAAKPKAEKATAMMPKKRMLFCIDRVVMVGVIRVYRSRYERDSREASLYGPFCGLDATAVAVLSCQCQCLVLVVGRHTNSTEMNGDGE